VPTTIATINVNGLRAATRDGRMHRWIDARRPDVVTMQEVRAPDALVADLLGDGWHVAHVEPVTKGRNGVAVAARVPLVGARDGGDCTALAGTGRWVEADLATADGRLLTIASSYAPTGDADVPARMAEKYAYFDAVCERLSDLVADDRHVLLTGDLNVAHTDLDLKNWKGNRGLAGCLPDERAYFDRWASDLGFVDVVRRLHGERPGPYAWWSYRGRAFDNDAGWRIDYQIASADLASTATSMSVDRAATYAERWSDHAPVVVTYELGLVAA
jgi:exodeoxyribonuclease-3